MITYSRLGKLGRLGNQLWQIASAVGIANSMEQLVGFPRWDYEPFFDVNHACFGRTTPMPGDTLIEAHHTPLVEHISEAHREYLQDYNLWSHMKDEIHDWFVPSEKALLQLYADYPLFWELEHPILSIHVRRGDNASEGPWKAQYHPLRPMSYYIEALLSLEGQYASAVVFSDDPEWCERNPEFARIGAHIFRGGKPRAKEHTREYRTQPILDWIDLHLMAFCDLHIIGNSTYAWWGAFLNHDNGAGTIYPSPWFGPALSDIDASLMFPPDWVEISHD